MRPTLESRHGGWVALGDGWTAYGKTKERALQAFRLAAKGSKRGRTLKSTQARFIFWSWPGLDA
jgi:hypothetical protein